jgi:hypothetical protein
MVPEPVEGSFQSTPPREGRHLPAWRDTKTPCFNPRPRARGDAGPGAVEVSFTGFNPRPRTRGDGYIEYLERVKGVSIHAPARGATTMDMQAIDR